MKTALHRPIVPLALACALALSACQQEAPAQFEDTAAQQGTQQQSAPDQDAAQEEGAGTAAPEAGAQDEQTGDDSTATDAAARVSQESAAAAGIDLTQVPDPIATATVPATVEGDPEATMQVSLLSLVRDGETVIANVSFRVDSEGGSTTPRWIYHYLGDFSWKPHLIDTTNLTRHDVLGTSPTWAMTESQGSKFSPGQTFYAYAAFAAPPEGTTTVNVHLVDGSPAATEVPIQ